MQASREPAKQGSAQRRVLLAVDDDANNLKLLVRIFRSEFDVHCAKDGQEALDLARRLHPAVIITDQRMARMTGIEFLSRIKEEQPLGIRILVTGYTDYEPLVEAVNSASVHHYFEKPFHTVSLQTVVQALMRSHELEHEREQLVARLQESVRQLEHANQQLSDKEAQLQSVVAQRTQELLQSNRELERINKELHVANATLRDLAVRDGLTGLFNYRYLIEHLRLEVSRSQRYGRCFSILFLDLDNFKAINDRHGHDVGDQVLCRVADLLRGGSAGVRSSDFVARYGGEEFCVVLTETDQHGAEIKAQRLRAAVAEQPWDDIHARLQGRVSVSVGVATFPDQGTTVEALLKAADDAQYEAKRRGKNQVVIAISP